MFYGIICITVREKVLSLNNKNIFQNSHIRARGIPENVGNFLSLNVVAETGR